MKKEIVLSLVSVLVCLSVLSVVMRVTYQTAEEKEKKAISIMTDSQPEAPPAAEQTWSLILVNQDKAVPKGYQPPLAEITNGYQVDQRIVADLTEMLEAAEAEGLKLIICSAYRSLSEQADLFNSKSRSYQETGLSKLEADKQTMTLIQQSGHSEHNLGLALDIVSRNNQRLDDSQAETVEQKWLLENSGFYGFILRYPQGREKETGVNYEPWHYRYVGKQAADIITNQQWILEDYN